MKDNPYSSRFKTKAGGPLPENLRFRGQQGRAIASSGEINASDKKDLMSQIGRLIDSYRQGDIVREDGREAKRKVAAERRQILQQAVADTTGQDWNALGQAIVEDISETTSREGFARNLLGFKELEQGEVARVRFRMRDVVAFIAASVSEIAPTIVRNNFITLPEFYISGNIMVEERDIQQSTGDILDEKYQEGLEAIMVQEDRLWKRFADQASVINNTITYFTTFTPGNFSQIRTQVSRWGLPVAQCLMAYDLWDDIIGTTGFSEWFDPIHMHELILEGILGSMLGVQLRTDAFRLPEMKVLDPGDLYMVATPETHGVLQQRGDLSANPVNSYHKNKPERGWYIFEMVASSIINAKSVAAGKRS